MKKAFAFGFAAVGLLVTLAYYYGPGRYSLALYHMMPTWGCFLSPPGRRPAILGIALTIGAPNAIAYGISGAAVGWVVEKISKRAAAPL